jgi:hypothetical protein
VPFKVTTLRNHVIRHSTETIHISALRSQPPFQTEFLPGKKVEPRSTQPNLYDAR